MSYLKLSVPSVTPVLHSVCRLYFRWRLNTVCSRLCTRVCVIWVWRVCLWGLIFFSFWNLSTRCLHTEGLYLSACLLAWFPFHEIALACEFSIIANHSRPHSSSSPSFLMVNAIREPSLKIHYANHKFVFSHLIFLFIISRWPSQISYLSPVIALSSLFSSF